MPHATVLEAPTPGPFLCGVGASALAGTAMASVAVAAASSEPATRAEVQDILECPSLLSRGRNPRSPARPSPWDWDRCVAVTTLGSTAFPLLSFRLPASTDGGSSHAGRDRKGRVWSVSRSCTPIEGTPGY